MKPSFTLVLIASFASLFLYESGNAFFYCGMIWYPPTWRAKIPLPVPLTAVDVHADFRGWTVGVTAELHYKNVNDDDVEVEFVFPLTENAAVYRMDATIAGRKLSAELKELQQARREYTQALKTGIKAALLENEDDKTDVFRLKLGNLPPNQTATISIGYVQPIDRNLDDGLLSFTLPVVFNPRYVPDVDKATFSSSVKYVAVSDVEYRLAFHAKVSLGLSRQIVDIKPRYANDTLSVLYGEGKLTASVDLVGDFKQDHDFQLLITPSKSQKPMVFIEPGLPVTDPSKPKSWLNYDIAAAWFDVPKSSAEATCKVSKDEYWFVVDRSSSMADLRSIVVRKVLAAAIRNLPLGAKFNIIGCGTRLIVLFPKGVVDYSEETAVMALEHILDIDGDMGASDILDPFEYIYKKPIRNDGKDGSRRFIFLLTDGEISFKNNLTSLVRQNADKGRVFSIGIGEGANTALINSLARVSNGLSEFVRSTSDRLLAKVTLLMKATIEHSAEDVHIDWHITGASVAETVPKSLATYFYAGGMVSQYAVFDRLPDKKTTGVLKFSAFLGGLPIDLRMDFEIDHLSELNDSLALHRLSAKMMLTELSDLYKANKSEEIRNETIGISLATGVLCEFTAFVAVDKEANATRLANDTENQALNVKVERPDVNAQKDSMDEHFPGDYDSYGPIHLPPLGFEGDVMDYSELSSDEAVPVPVALPVGLSIDGNEGIPMMGGMAAPAAPAAPMPEPVVSSEKVEVIENTSEPTEVLIDGESLYELQTFKGSWLLTEEFVKVIDSTKAATVDSLRALLIDAINSMASASTDDFKPDDEFIATVTGVTLLRYRFEAFRDNWQVNELKAMAYLRSTAFKGDFDSLFAKLASELSLS